MKKILLTVTFALFAIGAMAQSGRIVEKVVIYTTPFIPEHDFRLGIGIHPFTYGTENGGRYHYPISDYHTERDFQICAINLSYSYRLKSWLEVGALLSYNGIYNDVYLHRGEKEYVVGSKDITDISFVPMVRFSWYRSKYVRLYSAVGAGVTFTASRYETDITKERRLECNFAGQLTALGISAGRRLFGFTELGFRGSAGIVALGIGYRFPAKPKTLK